MNETKESLSSEAKLVLVCLLVPTFGIFFILGSVAVLTFLPVGLGFSIIIITAIPILKIAGKLDEWVNK